jgi:hypothetical protein
LIVSAIGPGAPFYNRDVRLSTMAGGEGLIVRRRGRVDPEEDCRLIARVEPSMSVTALEPEAVTHMQGMALELVEPHLEGPRQHVDEFLAGM